MSIEFIKKEIYYYTGKVVSNVEAFEILDIAEDNPYASLDEITTSYYYYQDMIEYAKQHGKEVVYHI